VDEDTLNRTSHTENTVEQDARAAYLAMHEEAARPMLEPPEDK
jgi:hypothetical protein